MRHLFQQVNAEDKQVAERMNKKMHKLVEALLFEIHKYHYHVARLKNPLTETTPPFIGKCQENIKELADIINALSLPYVIIPNKDKNPVIYSIVALTVHAFKDGFDIKNFAERLREPSKQYHQQRDAYFIKGENAISQYVLFPSA
jgi:hypothetical protein